MGRNLGLGDKLRAGVIDTPLRIWSHPYTRHERVRRLGRWLGWQVWERTARRPRTVTFHGDVRLVCHPHDHVASLALYHGLYDVEEMSFLLAWLRAGDTFLDVGANIAPYSLLATSVDGVRAVAFEPDEVGRRRAAANAALNGVTDRLELVASAVGDHDGDALFTDDHQPTAHLIDDAAAADDPAVEDRRRGRKVPIVRLDSYEADNDLGRVGLVKVDVEGHELAVLRGAAGLLERHRPALILEVNDPVAPLAEWIDRHGYVPVRYDRDRRTLEARERPSARGGNVILVPDLDAARARLAGAAGGATP